MKVSKKKLFVSVLVIIMAAALTACTKGNKTPQDNTGEETLSVTPVVTKEAAAGTYVNTTVVQEVGTMLTLSPMDEAYKAIVDNSGMNGSKGRIHLHSNSSADMYQGETKEFIFDIGHIEKLGELYLWNYNAEGATGSGLKEIAVSYSEDNVTYSEPLNYTLAQASGEAGLKATNTMDGSPVKFGGANGRYFKITVHSNYGGTENGLSEIRLFRYKQPIVVGESISASPLERFINSKWSAEAEEYNIVNGTGLSDIFSNTATHDNKPGHMYSQKATAIDFMIDLKGEYPVSDFVIWNYNDPEHLDYGLQKFRIKISDDATTWKTIGNYTLDKADGSTALKPSLTIDLGNVQTHYIQIEIMSNYGGERVGLSEVSAFLGKGWYVDEVPDYTALLSRYQGWTGADGIYTVNLDGQDYNYNRDKSQQNTFFIFSDTIISSVNPVTDLRSDVYMINNSSAVLKGGSPDYTKMKFRIPARDGNSANIIPNPALPATKEGKNIYYWLGDTFVSGDYLYVYSLRIDSVNTMFGFEQVGADLARYDIVDGAVNYNSLKLFNDDNKRLCDTSDKKAEFYFGGAVYQNTEAAGVINPDGYDYVYGYQDVENVGRELIVSRVKPENIENFDDYEYLDSDGNWVSDVPSKFMYLEDDIAPECSVTQIQTGENRGKYLFIWSYLTNSATIKASISDTPFSPFENQTTIYTHDTTLTTVGKGNNTYNAKAHPALSGPDELIISYNVNGSDCFTYGDIYRPRFLRLAQVAEKREQ